MICTKNEATAFDSFIIVHGTGNDAKFCGKYSYRNNLINALKEELKDKLPEDFNVTDSCDFRNLVDIAEKYGYHIYQLTRL